MVIERIWEMPNKYTFNNGACHNDTIVTVELSI